MGCIMDRCKKCGVYVGDATDVCPLCDRILSGNGQDMEDIYPDIRHTTRALKRLINIVTYFAVVLEIIFIIVNYYNLKDVKWSVITGVSILYLILTLQYTFTKRNGHIFKIFVQIFAAIILLIVIDFAIGYTGWSLNIGLPVIILVLDFIIVLCMLVNFKNWPSYMLIQVFTLFMSIVQMILYLTGVVEEIVLSWTSFGVSAIIFTFCVVIGGKKAKDELKRRFFI